MKPLDLTRTPEVLSSVRSAEMMTGAGLHQVARESAKAAVLKLLELLGVNERGRAVVAYMITCAESDGVSEYDLAVERGQVIDELARPYSHERDTRADADEELMERVEVR